MKLLFKFFSVLIASLFIVSASCAYAANGDVNWEGNSINATGIGVAPPNAVNIAQAKAMARRAAVVDAYRQLAEIISGVSVTSESTVQNFMTLSDTTRTKVNATIKGAKIVSESVTPDGGYQVTMTVPMFGVSGSLAKAVLEPPTVRESFPAPVESVEPSPAPATPSASVSTTVTVNIPTPAPSAPSTPSIPVPAPKPQPSTPPVTSDSSGSSAAPAPKGRAAGIYTGLVVDCRGLGLEPVMSPVIKNDSGSPIYGYKNLDSDKVVSNGMASYTKDINNYKRAGSNPLVVKAIRLDGNSCNPVLTTADANRVLIENGATKFLDNTNVVFVR